MSRVLILAFDALEYDLVEKFDMENLKQEEYGIIDIRDLLLSTPIIFASFITGLPPEKHGVRYRMWSSDFLEKLSAASIVRLGLRRIKGKRKILEKIGFKRGFHTQRHFKKKGIRTLFDIVDNSIALNVPSYQEWTTKELINSFHDAMKYSSRRDEFEERLWDFHEREVAECLRHIEQHDWKLIMAHFKFTDYFGHMFGGNLTKMWEVYTTADNLVTEIKTKIDSDDTLLLIMSDHGIRPIGKYGDHSDHGFYSLNQKMDLNNPKITDFFPIILEWLGYEHKRKNL